VLIYEAATGSSQHMSFSDYIYLLPEGTTEQTENRGMFKRTVFESIVLCAGKPKRNADTTPKLAMGQL
jgi:hypothetical protein